MHLGNQYHHYNNCGAEFAINVETAPGIEVILLQIGMVSSGTHLVKNHEFQ